MEFEWDRTKATANALKHAVTFEEAAEVFADYHSSTVEDPDNSTDEDRLLIFGETRKRRLLVVAFTERHAKIRIISARTMTRRERRAYEQ